MLKRDDNKKVKYFSTNLYPNTRIMIDGPCDIIFECVNSFGQGCFNFVVDRSTTIDTFKLNPKRIIKDNEGNK